MAFGKFKSFISKVGESPFPKDTVRQGPRRCSLFQPEAQQRDFLSQNLIVQETAVGRALGCALAFSLEWVEAELTGSEEGLQPSPRALTRETNTSLNHKTLTTWDAEAPSTPRLTVLPGTRHVVLQM